jgi:anti-sigma regulatory factor (Ser/Thr protein kinase)
MSCPGSPEEVARARRWTRDVLRNSPCADDAALIVTELSTNAVLHTNTDATAEQPPPAFYVSLSVSEALVSISVTDSGGTKTAPTIEHPDASETHGRGLAMVTALAHHVETRGDQHGHTVTAHLTTTKDAS